jgi:glutathione S-transferase
VTITKLFGTPLSHFTRKVRILLAELDVPFEFVRLTGLLSSEPGAYADHPMMRVPTLVHGDDRVLESDYIARYLVRRYDPQDRFRVLGEEVRDSNRLAVINGIMSNEVVIILAKRGGLHDTDRVVYFRKLLTAIDAGLAWLETETNPSRAALDYIDIATICMWQHLAYYHLVGGMERYPRLAERVAEFADRPSIASTAPEASLSAATAAGWRPG